MTETESDEFKHGVAKGFMSGPWFVVFYAFAFMSFCEFDWKLGVGWLLWRLGHRARKAWEAREEKEQQNQL